MNGCEKKVCSAELKGYGGWVDSDEERDCKTGNCHEPISEGRCRKRAYEQCEYSGEYTGRRWLYGKYSFKKVKIDSVQSPNRSIRLINNEDLSVRFRDDSAFWKYACSYMLAGIRCYTKI